ncbi:DUF397 domain-containing protein [Streptomyces sp. TG1A-8]|uniref:DUF397 domain-containing protein n=1 Tax=Streptomyces sp. TG1A-8 TaxID=3051385 RepID=UPI00265BC2DD|nr:DUF397 domain-containing protein [Streptomyces sp. TG1A-8]MDO0924852.1 DUF397 domain-containing protein [Streptomyces sp. TG1A-8]
MSVRHDKETAPEPAWTTSSYSTGNGGECVEVAAIAEAVLVRDSKRPAAARLSFGSDAWTDFVRMAAGH